MTLAAGLVPTSALAALMKAPARTLSLYNLHTGESLKTVYWEKDRYVSEGLSEINHLMRDYRLNLIKPIDLRLLDLLNALNSVLDTQQPFALISGYRSSATNAMLHARSQGVAAHSLHIDGMAADIRVPGRSLDSLRRAAVALRCGGVGYYSQSDFVHVDVGRVRYW
jgi:uncharacterized protein YcbK (DUF882 family)